MLKYAKVINMETKQCDVGLGTNKSFYESQGFSKQEVEKGRDGWYLKGYAPQKKLDDLKKEKIEELKKNCQDYIFSVYPVYKQLNIISPFSNFSESEKEAMAFFINGAREECTRREELINKAKNEKEINKINILFED